MSRWSSRITPGADGKRSAKRALPTGAGPARSGPLGDGDVVPLAALREIGRRDFCKTAAASLVALALPSCDPGRQRVSVGGIDDASAETLPAEVDLAVPPAPDMAAEADDLGLAPDDLAQREPPDLAQREGTDLAARRAPDIAERPVDLSRPGDDLATGETDLAQGAPSDMNGAGNRDLSGSANPDLAQSANPDMTQSANPDMTQSAATDMSEDLATTKGSCPPFVFDTRLSPAAIALDTAVYLMSQDLFVCRDQGGYFAMSSLCTHEGCTLEFGGYQPGYFCPCHHAFFDFGGAVTAGPPKQDLPHYAVCLTAAATLGIDPAGPVDPATRFNP